MKLQALQEDFQAKLLMQVYEGADWVAASTGNLSAQERIGIYHNAYRVRLIDVLRENFEHTAIYLGDEWFYRLAREFVEAHPSGDHNISYYGEGFPRFLATRLPNDLDVAELAELDWHLRRAFDGSDSEVMTLEDLQRLMTEGAGELCLRFVPTTTLVTHHHNTIEIWHAIDSDREPPMAQQLEKPVDVLLWRKAHSPHFRSLSATETCATRRLFDDGDVNRMGEHLLAKFPNENVAELIGQFLQRWIAEEVLARDS